VEGRPPARAADRRTRHLHAARVPTRRGIPVRLEEDWATVAGENTKLQVAHVKFSHSRAFLLRAYLLQTHEMLFDAHWQAFRVFGGVLGRGIYDSVH
jgi:transposase